MKAILRSLQVNSEIDQDLYPTLDPMRRVGSVGSAHYSNNSSNSRNSGSRDKSLTVANVATTAAVGSVSPDIVSSEDAEGTNTDGLNTPVVLALNSSTGMNCLDNRFPSSPVSDDQRGL